MALTLGDFIAFKLFNKYPARIFPGNSGSLLFGGAVGAMIVLNNLEIFGIVILIPHIINFLLWIYWVANMKVIPHVKFAKVNEDGTIEPPNKLTLKYLVTSIYKVNENQATWILYAITGVFCVLGVIFVS